MTEEKYKTKLIDIYNSDVEYIIQNVVHKYYLLNDSNERNNFPDKEIEKNISLNTRGDYTGSFVIIKSDDFERFSFSCNVSSYSSFFKNESIGGPTERVFYQKFDNGYYEVWISHRSLNMNRLNKCIFYVTYSDSIMSPRTIIKKTEYFFEKIEDRGNIINLPVDNADFIWRVQPWWYFMSYTDYPEIQQTIITEEYRDAIDNHLLTEEQVNLYLKQNKNYICNVYLRKMTTSEYMYFKIRSKKMEKKLCR